MVEAVLQRVLLARLNTIPGVWCWRANTGMARMGDRTVAFGIKGQADISGLIGPRGRRLEIEVKSDTGRQSPEQIAFQHRVEALGGLYILARDIDATLSAVSAAAFEARHA